jgi:transcriptional regulator with XRE-family HTH domain
MEMLSHAPFYQRSVYISRGQTFIGANTLLMHKHAVANDPAFGARLKALIPLAGYKNARRFAIDGMGWPDSAGPQRLNGYLKGRVPEAETLIQLAEALGVTVTELLGLDASSSAADESLQGILRHLLELEGIPHDKADTIASALIAARQLFQAFPDEEPLPVRTKYAARAAWIQRQQPAPNR